jgi:hypothetical protein
MKTKVYNCLLLLLIALTFCGITYVSASCEDNLIDYSSIINSFPSNTFVKLYLEHMNSIFGLEHVRIPTTHIKVNSTFSSNTDDYHQRKFLPVLDSKIALRSNNTLVILCISISHPQRNKLIGKILTHASGRNSLYHRTSINTERVYVFSIQNQLIFLNLVFNKTLFHDWALHYFPKFALLYTMTQKEPPQNVRFVLCTLVFKSTGITLSCNGWNTELNPSQVDKSIIQPSEWAISFISKKLSHKKKIFHPSISLKSHLVLILLEKGNLTSLRPTASTRGHPSFREEIVTQFSNFFTTSVLINTNFVQFLTCHTKQALKFDMYIIPFQPAVWASIGLSTSIIIAFTYAYLKLSDKYRSLRFCPVLFYLSFLVEDSCPTPSSLRNDSKFRILSGIWLLSVVVLVNCYIGLMIMEVSSPLKGTRVKYFNEIRCNKSKQYFDGKHGLAFEAYLFWSYKNYSMKVWQDLPSASITGGFNSTKAEKYLEEFQKLNECFSLLSKPVKALNASTGMQFRANPFLYSNFKDNVEKMETEYPGVARMKYIELVSGFLSPEHRHYPDDPKFNQNADPSDFLSAAIEKELLACGLSTFLGERRELLKELSYLNVNYPRVKFYISKDTLNLYGPDRTVWMFSGYGESKIPTHFVNLFEAGIPLELGQLELEYKYANRRDGTNLIHGQFTQRISVSIGGSIQTIFIIWACGITLSLIAIVFEKRSVIWNWLMNIKIRMRIVIHSMIFKVMHVAVVLRYK